MSELSGLDQGRKSHALFVGNGKTLATKILYGKSAVFFSDIIKENLFPNKKYILLDLGSFRGELLKNTLKLLKSFKFETIAIDLNKEALEVNKANKKFISNLANIPLKDKSVDITFLRYSLQWNGLEIQKKIISEIKRVTKKIAIIQHAGADCKDSFDWRKKVNIIFNGDIKCLKRDEMFFSSSKEIEEIMVNNKISFNRLEDIKVDGLSDIFIEKYSLNKIDSNKLKSFLKSKDYIMKTTWVLNFD